MSAQFEIKDSGKHVTFASGMKRDNTEDKIDYTLALDGPMFERYAAHLSKAAKKKYPKRNWMKAYTQEELARGREGLARHFVQYMRGDTDEDHASAIIFGLNLCEYIHGRMSEIDFNAGPRPLEDFDRPEKLQDNPLYDRTKAPRTIHELNALEDGAVNGDPILRRMRAPEELCRVETITFKPNSQPNPLYDQTKKPIKYDGLLD
jgi:hypothetical protein